MFRYILKGNLRSMPFDPVLTSFGSRPALARRTRPVAIWLFGMCAMLWVMITLGGATRLTGSGLSIMEWAPLRGALPPLSEAEWQRLYALYQQIPQYALVNQGFGIEGFKGIFWLEWAHRLWGRLIGVGFLVPLLWFAWRGYIDKRLGWRLGGLFALGGLQGAVGWFMVASGFAADSTAVSPYRLVVHLSLALTLYGAILWTALSLWRDRGVAPGPATPVGLRWLMRGVLASVALTILAGGFVAGLKAGFTYNSFPLMDGHWVPDGYAAAQPFWRSFFEDVATVQFNHRLLATATGVFALGTAMWGFRRAAPGPARLALLILGSLVTAQYALGVATLLWVVPVALGTAHQGLAVLVLTAALVALHLQRPAHTGQPREASR